MKNTLFLLIAIFCVFSTNLGADLKTILPKHMQARHFRQSQVIDTPHGQCRETLPNQNPKPHYGDFASFRKAKLDAGYYRATFWVHAEGKGGGRSTMSCQVSAGKKTFSTPFFMANMRESKEPLPITVSFQLDQTTKRVNFSCSWLFAGRHIDKVRVYKIEIHGPQPVFIANHRVEKILYKPDQSATLSFDIVNQGQKEWTGSTESVHIAGIDTRLGKKHTTITLKPGATQTLRHDFPLKNISFGHEIRTRLNKGEETIQSIREVFCASKRLWDVSLGSINNGILANTGMYGKITDTLVEDKVKSMRKHHSNWFEMTFWAPDDWGNLTPENESWISGQARRHSNAKVIKKLIDLGHTHGIKAITYGKGIAGGPSGYETFRQNPEWFQRQRSGRWINHAAVWDLENWEEPNDPKNPKKYQSIWHKLLVDLAKPAALNHGIQELLESTKRFGWDGVRFDGHFSAVDDTVSTHNMQELKRQIWKHYPDYVFGFNMGDVFARNGKFPHEEREAMAGGGHWMHEGINHWAHKGNELYKTWSHYAEGETEAGRVIREMGGNYHHIFSLKGNEATRYYKFLIGILAGAHPTYGAHENAPGAENWGAFLTRWGGLVWDHRQKSAQAKTWGITLKGPTSENIRWKTWLKHLPFNANESWLVVPVLSMPTNDEIAKTKFFPASLGEFQLGFKSKVGKAKLKSAHWIESGHNIEDLNIEEGRIKIRSAERFGIVILKWNHPEILLTKALPRFSQKVDPAKLERSRQKENNIVVVDPLRPELNKKEESVSDSLQLECEDTMWSHKRKEFLDPMASGGKACGADKSFPYAVTGQHFFDLAPGVYDISIRVRRQAGKYSATIPVTCYENLTRGYREGSMKKRVYQLKDFGDGEYVELDVFKNYEHHGRGFSTFFLHINIPKSAPKDAKILVDWVRFDKVRDIHDREIVKTMKRKKKTVEKAEISTDEMALDEIIADAEDEVKASSTKSRILWVRGLFDELYQLDELLGHHKNTVLDIVYLRNLKITPEYLKSYSHLILPNVPVDRFDALMRKDIHDWVGKGGHLLLLGGNLGLGQAKMRLSFFEDLLPCKLLRDNDVVSCNPPAKITVGDKPTGAHVYYRHEIEAKSGAKILAHAKNMPIALSNTYEKGRCSVFAGTVLGTQRNDPKAFWNRPEWKGLFTNLIQL